MNSRRRQRTASMALTLALGLGAPHVLADQESAVLAARLSQAQAAVDPGVRDALQRYSAAFESLDVNAVKKIQPSVPAESLAKAFRDMRELKVTIDDLRVLSADKSTARVSCRVTQTLTPKVGSKQTTTVIRVMRLKRAVDAWVVDGFER